MKRTLHESDDRPDGSPSRPRPRRGGFRSLSRIIVGAFVLGLGTGCGSSASTGEVRFATAVDPGARAGFVMSTSEVRTALAEPAASAAGTTSPAPIGWKDEHLGVRTAAESAWPPLARIVVVEHHEVVGESWGRTRRWGRMTTRSRIVTRGERR